MVALGTLGTFAERGFSVSRVREVQSFGYTLQKVVLVFDPTIKRQGIHGSLEVIQKSLLKLLDLS